MPLLLNSDGPRKNRILSALPDAERRAAWQSLSEDQRQMLLDYFKDQSSIDASVAGTVDGKPFPAAWLVPAEQPAAPAPPDPGLLEQRRR